MSTGTKYHKPDTTSSAYGKGAAASAAAHASAATEASPAVSAEVGDISSRPVSGVALDDTEVKPLAKPLSEPVTKPVAAAEPVTKTVVAEPEPIPEPAVDPVVETKPAASTASKPATSGASAPKTATKKATSPATNAAVAAASGTSSSAPHQPPKRPGHKPKQDGGIMSKICCCFSSEPEYETQTRPANAATASASSSTAYEPKVMVRPEGGAESKTKPVDKHASPAAGKGAGAGTTGGVAGSAGAGVAAVGAGVAAGAAGVASAVSHAAHATHVRAPSDPHDAHTPSPAEAQQVDKLADDSSAYELADVIPASGASEFSSDPRYFAPSQGWLLNPVSDQLSRRKCLVLDLDETLVHSSFKYIHQADFVIPVEIEGQYHNVYVIKRPGVDEFMKRVGEIYEVVVFTASVSKYGDPLLDQLDIHNVVHHRLFRESCYNHQGNYIKNLSQLGRPLKDVIIIDNSPASYIFHPQHAIPVSSWFSDAHDNELLDMLPFLEDMSKPKVEDVSLVLDVNM